MKKPLYVFACLLLINIQLMAQDPAPVEDSKFAVTVGFLNGGGSLIGADFEIMAGERVGLQVGAGLVGLGAGINYHLKPGIFMRVFLKPIEKSFYYLVKVFNHISEF